MTKTLPPPPPTRLICDLFLASLCLGILVLICASVLGAIIFCAAIIGIITRCLNIFAQPFFF